MRKLSIDLRFENRFMILNCEGIHLYKNIDDFFKLNKPLLSIKMTQVVECKYLDSKLLTDFKIINYNKELHTFYIKFDESINLNQFKKSRSYKSKKSFDSSDLGDGIIC